MFETDGIGQTPSSFEIILFLKVIWRIVIVSKNSSPFIEVNTRLWIQLATGSSEWDNNL